MPRCKKEKVYFLLDNTKNIERNARGDEMEFWDNCGFGTQNQFQTKRLIVFTLTTDCVQFSKKALLRLAEESK